MDIVRSWYSRRKCDPRQHHRHQPLSDLYVSVWYQRKFGFKRPELDGRYLSFSVMLNVWDILMVAVLISLLKPLKNRWHWPKKASPAKLRLKSSGSFLFCQIAQNFISVSIHIGTAGFSFVPSGPEEYEWKRHGIQSADLVKALIVAWHGQLYFQVVSVSPWLNWTIEMLTI